MATPIIPLYTVERGGGPIDVGLIMLVNSILTAALSIPLGALSDRVGRRAVLLLGAFTGAMGNFLLPLASTPFIILILYGMAGGGHAAYSSASSAMVADIASKDTMASAFGWTQIARQTGNLAGPALGGFLASLFGYSSTFIACGIFLTIGTVLTALFVHTQTKKDSTITKEAGVARTISKAVSNIVIIVALMCSFSTGFVLLAYRSFIPLYLNNLGIDPSYIGILFTVQALASISVRIPIARYSDRTGRRAPFIIFGLLSMAASMVLIISTSNLLVILGWAAFLGFGNALVAIVSAVIIAEKAVKETRGVLFGIQSAATHSGQGVGAVFTGAVIESYGFEAGFRSVAIIAAATALAFIIGIRRTKAIK